MKLFYENGISYELQSIIENTNDLMFVKNRDFVYIASSKNYALDCVRCNGAEDVIGKTDFELYEDSSIAERYRADDEKMFAENSPMIVFQEEYPDRNGKKHRCLTTKYLLHDENGEPMAIFGQYHDIDDHIEDEITQRRCMEHKITKALNGMFFASYLIDLKDGSYDIMRGEEYARKVFRNCKDIKEIFERFVNELVCADDSDKVREFCCVETIAERLKNRGHIDCEYRGNFVDGWCQCSFVPVDYDEGKLKHVLLVISSIDQRRAKNLEEGISLKKNMEAFFNVVPAGVVVYKWDGEKLTFLTTNQYYRGLFGYDAIFEGDEPAYIHIHPDDVGGYHKAIAESLSSNHHLEYTFRIWNEKRNRYCWLQINAILKQQGNEIANSNLNENSLVYAIFTDITAQKDAEIEVARKQALLEAALDAANQLCCEYDPMLHTEEFLTATNFFNLPVTLDNYPECLKDYDIIHPEDINLFIETAHTSDDGISVHCDVRAKRDGKYRWYSCRFEPYFDPEKGRNTVILTIIDANVRMASIQSYKDRLNALENANANALCMCDVNVTKNSFANVQANAIIKECGKKAENLDEFMILASQGICDPEEQQFYRALFNREKLLELFEQGERHIKFGHYYRINATETAMIETVFDLMKEPLSGDVVGISYAKDVNVIKLSEIMLNASLERDYPMAALVYTDTGEFYMYEVARGEYCVHRENYWQTVYDRIGDSVEGQELEKIRRNLNRENVVKQLEKKPEYSYPFYGYYNGIRCRLEAKFRYIDKKNHLMLGSLRNITDEELIRKYKHDSEHDALTGLLNRKNVFKKIRRMIEEHPDDQLVILHCDIMHFHLYNTFFGEDAGDRLLCKVAEVLETVSKEYEYMAYGRIESDVFCVCFPVKQNLFKKHIRMCEDELVRYSPDFPIRMVMGAYWITDPAMSIEAMFSRSTIAAKSHKNNLFGLVSKYDELMDDELRETQQITSEMTAAIEQEQFHVYLQPKYSLRSDKLIGAEALVRWKHPERGMIMPGKFIPVFEKNGFIANLDRYMWEHVCRILRNWQDEGTPMYPISVNISRVSMYSHATVPFLKSLIEKYRLDPKYLELELTETAYMDDPEDLKRMLKELKEYGFKILMDDFGSGYSSLNTLRELPVNVLKLDMKFLTLSQDDVRGNAVLSSVVRMSKLLNLPIVAEGVEKPEQADYLRSIGCEYVQGFLYARPMPTDEYKALLNDRKIAKENVVPENNEPASLAFSEVVVEEPFLPLGLLEYDKERFAYLRTNKKFLKEFDLIENLKPASKVFREHMDDRNYNVLLRAFAACSETKKDSYCSLNWEADDGITRKYHGYVHYQGNIGNYADLAVTFMNVTEVNSFGDEDAPAGNAELEAQIAELKHRLSFLSAAIDNMPNPIFMKGSDGRFVYFNQRYAECFNMTRDKYIGGTVLDLEYLPEEDRQKYQEEDLKLIETGQISSYDKNFIFNDGEVHPSFYWSKGFVCPDNGERGLIGEIVDISGERKIKDNLSEIVRGTAHLFERFFVVDLENGVYSTVEKKEDYENEIMVSSPSTEFFQKANGRFYNPLNKHLIDYCFTPDGLQEMLKDKDDYYIECKDKLYEELIFGVTIYCIERSENIPTKVIYAVRDITDTKMNEQKYHERLKKSNERLKDIANRDALTGLYNRRGLMEVVNTQLTEDTRIAMLLIDIDEFKTINDTYGHIAGDGILKRVADQLKSTFRSNDVFVRLGGDEFMALIMDCNLEMGGFITNKIKEINEVLSNPKEDIPACSLSVGVAFSRVNETQELYNRADAALYKVKESGRCGCCVYEEEIDPGENE